MIGYLSGTVRDSHDYVNTIECGGVGYEVHVTESPGVGLPQFLWVHEHAPQDAPHELYGFREREQRDIFRRLLNIKGVGPKVAMRIVGAGFGTTAEFRYHEALTKIRGVGATLAQRIVEEMR